MKAVNMPPDAPSLMWSTRAIGYTTPAAVADIIDNSVSANATEIRMEFISGENAHVSILDNGRGMNYNELKLAMKYGSGDPFEERNENDLGRFGLGLKTASFSQCRTLTVASKKNGQVVAFCWDLDHVFSVHEWELLELDDGEIEKLPQINLLNEQREGTLVVWERLDRLVAGDEDKDRGLLKKKTEVDEHLALTFHRFLQGEPGLQRIKIISNGIQIKARDPFYIAKSDAMPSEKIPIKYKTKEGKTETAIVLVTPYVLPFADSLKQEEIDDLGGKEGLIKNQGFYVYRNKRLIVPADWFKLARKTDLTKLCRVKVDMPNSLDELWTIDVKKSMAVPPEIVLKTLKRIITPIISAGKRKYKFRAKKERNAEEVKIWIPQETRNGVIYTINSEYPVLKELMDEVEDKKKLRALLHLIEQSIPVNAIHSDFYDDKKYAFEDTNVALQNVCQNLKDLLTDVKREERKSAFEELMEIMPFSEYDISLDDLGDF